MHRLLRYAATIAARGARDGKQFLVGAVAIRNDGAVVHARNAASREPSPAGHAEARLMQKAGTNAVVFVARVRRGGGMALAKPCPRCLAHMRAQRVTRVYYTISDTEYGVVDL